MAVPGGERIVRPDESTEHISPPAIPPGQGAAVRSGHELEPPPSLYEEGRRAEGSDRRLASRGSGADGDHRKSLEFDPVSLKEPTGLHEWDWLGVPRRCLRYLLHKLVLEVDGRDQHCALVLWSLLLLSFLVYIVLIVRQPFLARRLPAQSLSYLNTGPETERLHHLPYIVVCPQVDLNDTGVGSYPIMAFSSGWEVEHAVSNIRGFTQINVSAYDLMPTATTGFEHCPAKRCVYFDGPTFSAKPNRSVAIEDRWIGFYIFMSVVSAPPAPYNSTSVTLTTPYLRLANAWVYVGLDRPKQLCHSDQAKSFIISVPLQRWGDAAHVNFFTTLYRLRLTRYLKLGAHPNLWGRSEGQLRFTYEMHSIGEMDAQAMTLAPNIPNITVHAGAISFSIHPSITNVEEIEPVNLLNMLGVIAGSWTFFTLIFKLCFPSVRSGRRRVVSPLRRIVAQIMPKSKGDHLKHFAAVLGPAAAYRVELKEEVEETGRVGSEAGKPPIEDEDQGRQGSARSLRHRGNGSLGSQLFTFGSSVREGSTAEEQQVALLEMPGVEDRLLLIEQAVKTLMEAEAARREVGSAVESR